MSVLEEESFDKILKILEEHGVILKEFSSIDRVNKCPNDTCNFRTVVRCEKCNLIWIPVVKIKNL